MSTLFSLYGGGDYFPPKEIEKSIFGMQNLILEIIEGNLDLDDELFTTVEAQTRIHEFIPQLWPFFKQMLNRFKNKGLTFVLDVDVFSSIMYELLCKVFTLPPTLEEEKEVEEYSSNICPQIIDFEAYLDHGFKANNLTDFKNILGERIARISSLCPPKKSFQNSFPELSKALESLASDFFPAAACWLEQKEQETGRIHSQLQSLQNDFSKYKLKTEQMLEVADLELLTSNEKLKSCQENVWKLKTEISKSEGKVQKSKKTIENLLASNAMLKNFAEASRTQEAANLGPNLSFENTMLKREVSALNVFQTEIMRENMDFRLEVQETVNLVSQLRSLISVLFESSKTTFDANPPNHLLGCIERIFSDLFTRLNVNEAFGPLHRKAREANGDAVSPTVPLEGHHPAVRPTAKLKKRGRWFPLPMERRVTTD